MSPLDGRWHNACGDEAALRGCQRELLLQELDEETTHEGARYQATEGALIEARRVLAGVLEGVAMAAGVESPVARELSNEADGWLLGITRAEAAAVERHEDCLRELARRRISVEDMPPKRDNGAMARAEEGRPWR